MGADIKSKINREIAVPTIIAALICGYFEGSIGSMIALAAGTVWHAVAEESAKTSTQLDDLVTKVMALVLSKLGRDDLFRKMRREGFRAQGRTKIAPGRAGPACERGRAKSRFAAVEVAVSAGASLRVPTPHDDAVAVSTACSRVIGSAQCPC